jgi:hypothetical protein
LDWVGMVRLGLFCWVRFDRKTVDQLLAHLLRQHNLHLKQKITTLKNVTLARPLVSLLTPINLIYLKYSWNRDGIAPKSQQMVSAF